MERPFERVYTIIEVHDGPRAGIAELDGRPHTYSAVFDDVADEYSDWFELRPVDDETLRMVLESWALWRRWQNAWKAGHVTLDTHPALPEDRGRQDELAPMLKERLAALPGPPVRARATFRTDPVDPERVEVRWMIEP